VHSYFATERTGSEVQVHWYFGTEGVNLYTAVVIMSMKNIQNLSGDNAAGPALVQIAPHFQSYPGNTLETPCHLEKAFLCHPDMTTSQNAHPFPANPVGDPVLCHTLDS
jgi:hypothetical protein